MSDPRIPSSYCCGSVQKLSSGDWVMSWGGNTEMTEMSPAGVPQLTITYPTEFSYREEPLKASVHALRSGMDVMVPPLAITADTTPPTTTIGAPASGAVLTGGQWLDAAASDDVGVVHVDFRVTGGSLNNALICSAVLTDFGWLGGWNTSAVPNGSYTLSSVAYDAAGNSAVSPGVPVTVAKLASLRLPLARPGGPVWVRDAG